MSQKSTLNGFKGVEIKSQFSQDFLNSMFNILKSYTRSIRVYHFYQKEWNLRKLTAGVIKESVVHIRNLKQALNHRLKMNRVNKLNQKALLNHTLIWTHRAKKESKQIISKNIFSN